jgi:hypothetical protein
MVFRGAHVTADPTVPDVDSPKQFRAAPASRGPHGVWRALGAHHARDADHYAWATRGALIASRFRRDKAQSMRVAALGRRRIVHSACEGVKANVSRSIDARV